MVSKVQGSATPTPTTTNAREDSQYTVKSGDTLWQIAQQHGVSLQKLLDDNPQFKANPDLIHPGQGVKIPAKSEAPTSAPPVAEDEAAPSTRSGEGTRERAAASGVDPRSLSAPTDRGSLGSVDKLIDKTARVEGGGR